MFAASNMHQRISGGIKLEYFLFHRKLNSNISTQGWPLSAMTSLASMAINSLATEKGKFTIAIRIPKSYPNQPPDIACITGGEVLFLILP